MELNTHWRELAASGMICCMHVHGVRGKEAMSSVELFAKAAMPACAVAAT